MLITILKGRLEMSVQLLIGACDHCLASQPHMLQVVDVMVIVVAGSSKGCG